MKTALKVICAVLILCIIIFVGINNNLVTLKEDVEMQQSQVQTTLQRRSDLIPNLVATVKGYAAHEEKVFTEISEARSKLAGCIETGDMESISNANSSLDSALGRLLAISESYPELKASEQFIALQDELAGTENRIAVARQYYNEKAIQTFPNSMIAGLNGYKSMPYFEADESASKVPEVNFE